MNFNLSIKAKNIAPSVTLEITAKANEMKSKGIDVIGFGAGEPDFNTPKNIQDVGIEAIRDGKTRYTPTPGIIQLREAACEKFKRDNNLDYEPKNILVSSGAKHSLYNTLCTILNPEDEVIVPNPYWVSYPELVKIADGVPVMVETKEENGFKYKLEDLNNALTDKTKAIFLNSPSNPTGTVYSIEELKAIADWAVENEIFVISDEIYEKLIYDGEKHVSIASLNDKIKDLTIVINGMSKAYAMTGWRLGIAAAHEDIIKVMTNLQSHSTSNASSISQYASVEGLKGDQSIIEEMKKHFVERRNYMVDKINSIHGMSCKKPKGAFYVMANISELKGKVINGKNIESSVDLAGLLLEEAKVAVIPGLAFGSDDYVRLSYATSMDNIKEGLDRIEKLLLR